MLKKLAIALVVAIAAWPQTSLAETVMEKVARTEVLTLGTRTDSIPYAYLNDRQELVGYTIDLVRLIEAQLEAELGKDITVQIVEIDSIADRIAQLVSGSIDLSCDNVFTWERDRTVDFSLSYGISGVRLLVKGGSNLGSPESLASRRIGVLANTIVAQVIQKVQPEAQLVAIANIEEGFAALDSGKIEALAGDTIVLAGEALRRPNTYQVVPETAYASYGIACMVPEDNSSFLDLVNFTLASLMQGYLVGEAESVAIIDRWFGPQGLVAIPPDLIRSFFQNRLIVREQVPLTSSGTPRQ